MRLLDLVDGHTAVAHGAWLADQGEAYTGSIRESTLDPFHGYANAILGELPEAISVVDAFHVVELGGQIVEAGRRRVPQDTLGRRGGLAIPGMGPPYPTDRGSTPDPETHSQIEREARARVTPRGHCVLELLSEAARGLPRPALARRRPMAENSDAFPSCPIPELARLGSALRKWKAQILAYFDTAGASNGPTKAINGVIGKARSRSRQRWIYTKECMRSTWGEHRPGSPNPRAGPLLHMLTVETTLRPGRQPKSLTQ